MPGEIGQARYAERRRLRRNHRERVAVCEAKRHADREAVGRQYPVELGERRYALHAEQLEGDGAGVLRVDVYRARLERRMQDGGASHALLVHRLGRPRLRRGLRHDLAQHVGLGEALGAYAQGPLRPRERRDEKEHCEDPRTA